MLWSHISSIALVAQNSNPPHNDIGRYMPACMTCICIHVYICIHIYIRHIYIYRNDVYMCVYVL